MDSESSPLEDSLVCGESPAPPASDARQRRQHFLFDSYVPLLDPDVFDQPDFYIALERLGYRQVLLGGTGAADLPATVEMVKRHTRLTVALYPSGPSAVTRAADVVILPDVMNSDAPHARPFGSGAVATALNIARQGVDYVPAAYFILGRSTARWFYSAFPLDKPRLLLAYANSAEMIGYPYLALDCEGAGGEVSDTTLAQLRQVFSGRLVVSQQVTPARAAALLALGVDTLITPSNLYEEAADPVALAATYRPLLAAPRVP